MFVAMVGYMNSSQKHFELGPILSSSVSRLNNNLVGFVAVRTSEAVAVDLTSFMGDIILTPHDGLRKISN